MMKVASHIFNAIAWLALPVCFLITLFVMDDEAVITLYIAGAVLFLLCGIIAHILITKYRNNNGGGQTALYVITFIPYAIPFLIIAAVYLILVFIDWLVYVFTDKHYVASFLAWCKEIFFGKPKNRTAPVGEDVYVVVDGGYERMLAFTEAKQDHDNGLVYNRFKDDIGKYWRSYDNNQTFIKETAEQMSRGY